MSLNRRRLVLLFLGVLVAIALAFWFVPREGYRFPSTSGIASMEAQIFDPKAAQHTFVVPIAHYEGILSALSPSTYDAFPKKWQMLGELEIHTVEGDSIHVELYDLGEDSSGAFAAGPTFQTRTYYRGGNSSQLRRSLEKARVVSAPR